MSDPRDYVPSEAVVRAAVNAPSIGPVGGCLMTPRSLDALLHVGECASCQASLDADAPALDGYDDALGYVPTESLVACVVSESLRRRYRVRLLHDRPAARAQPRYVKRAAALFGVWALSPVALAAAIVVHAAIGFALARVTVFSDGHPPDRRTEHVEYEPLAMMRPTPMDGGERRGVARRALAMAVERVMPVAVVGKGLPLAERERLDSTAARIRRDPSARILLEVERSREALSAAELIGRYLIEHGVQRAQVKIVAGGENAGRLRVTLDTIVIPQ